MKETMLDKAKRFFKLMHVEKTYSKWGSRDIPEFDPNFGLNVDVCHTKKSVSCDNCDGTGYKKYDELTDYHRRDYSTRIEKCHQCSGHGRHFKHTLRVTAKAVKSTWNSQITNETDQYEVTEHETIPVQVDYTDYQMSKRYSELEQYRPSEYLKKIEEYRTLYALEKDRKD